MAGVNWKSSAQREVDQPHELEEVRTAVMHGNWEKVVEIYEANPSISTTISCVGDTFLHLAILVCNQDGVIQLVNLMEKLDKGKILEKLLQTGNHWGSTPLHQAAFMGMDEVCSFIAQHDCTEKVVCCRNKQGETPLHVAALHGQKRAFFALQMVIEAKGWSARDWNTGGDTMLHSAIAREHFDLALDIIELYPDLLQYKNNKQELPLHILANNPSAFKSGTYLNILDRIIYQGLPRMDFQLEYPAYKKNGGQDLRDDHKKCDAPWTNDGDDMSKHTIDVESSGEGIKKGDQADQEKTVVQNLKSFFKNIFSQVLKAIVFLFLFTGKVKEIRKKKTKNAYAYRVMQELVSRTKGWQFKSDGKKPANVSKAKKQFEATPILIAAKRGVIEMVKEILKMYPLAIDEMNSDGKNIVLLAAEYGQTHIYKYMLKMGGMLSSVGMVDKHGNSALHLAAISIQKRHWSIPGAAFQMQAEVKWYKYIKKSVTPGFFALYNSEGKLARKIFINTHEELMKDARDWLIRTSQSCSVVAALVAAAAYTAATSVPGGNDRNTGIPMFNGQRAFQVFAMSSPIALCFSVTALVCFLSIVTSRFRASDFETALPAKLIGGMTTLFVSIAANLISFFAGHFYIIHNKHESRVYLLYAVLSFPLMAFFLTSQFWLYFDLIRALFFWEPERSKTPHYI